MKTWIYIFFKLTEKLVSQSLATETRKKINDSFTTNDPSYYGAVVYNPDDQGTSHVSTLDKDGLAVSVTSTVNLLYKIILLLTTDTLKFH